MSSLAQLVEPYGAPAESVIDFASEPDARHIGYLDLLGTDRRDKSLPHGVVLLRNESIAYLVAADAGRRPPEPKELGHMRRILAFRDDAPYLTVIEPGKLSVYGVALDGLAPEEALLGTVDMAGPEARTTFHRLQTRPDALFTWAPEREQAIEQRLFELMNQAVDGLKGCGVELNDAISLAGRALFTRFLLDRGIMKDTRRGNVCPGAQRWEDVFSSAAHVRATCTWLNRTFNGDFLPVSLLASKPSKLEQLPPSGFEVLGDIMHGPRSQQGFLWSSSDGWRNLDFAHIPVGILSQVYERQAERWNPEHRHESSMYYTPRRIAEYMVKEAFALARAQGNLELHKARVLDPAVGGGVFLVAALRELAAEWWRIKEKPPNSKELRRILYKQIAGFDIEEPALRLTALSLYLTVIELDRNPTRMEDLRFEKPLRDRVLYMMREPTTAANAVVAGSLGPMVGEEHRGAYDIVIGNPPWTSSKRMAKQAAERLHAEIRRTVTPIVEERLGPERAWGVKLPDKVPDVPFVWRAMEWAVSDGVIALALHARLLFKGSDVGESARADLFDAMEVIGVLNGTDLRLTKVWPKVEAQFCLLFARNRQPDERSTFYLISPYEEKILNDQGRLRIDAAAAHPISMARLRKWPELLKVLFRGNALDADILGRLQQRNLPAVKSWWEKTLGPDTTARGYEVGREAKRRQDASFLLGKPNLTTKSRPDYIIDSSQLSPFRERRLYRAKDPKIYKPPLVLVKQSPHADRNRARAYVCYEAPEYLAYNESFYGYSAHGHPEAKTLVQYISLLIHSELFLWHALMTSGKFGVERDALLKIDIDEFPLLPMEYLSEEHRRKIPERFDAMTTSHDRDAADRWVYKCYGLNRWDQEVIRDTLAMSLPFAANKKAAQEPPLEQEITAYRGRVQAELAPFIPGVCVRLVENDWAKTSPWCMFLVESRPTRRPAALSSALITRFMNQADELGASQLVLTDPQASRLLVGILRQRRYFTQTRARLCSLEIIDEHSDALLAAAGKKNAS